MLSLITAYFHAHAHAHAHVVQFSCFIDLLCGSWWMIIKLGRQTFLKLLLSAFTFQMYWAVDSIFNGNSAVHYMFHKLSSLNVVCA